MSIGLRVAVAALIFAMFAAEVAIVQFVGDRSSLDLDGQTYILPIT